MKKLSNRMRPFYIFMGIIFVQCSAADRKEKRVVEPDQIIDMMNVSDLSQYTLTSTGSELLATDSRSNSVYLFDYETLDLVDTFGKTGSGPGEFNGALYSAYDSTNIYTFDSGNQNISVFSRENRSYQFTLSAGRNASRFLVLSRSIYLSSPFGNTETPFLKIDMEGNAEFFETNPGTNGLTTTFCIHNSRLYSNGGMGGLNLYVFDLSFLKE